MLHALEVEPGEYTSTVRNGLKWADLKIGERIELCVCTPTPQDHKIEGEGEIVGLWFGKFGDIPARLIANEHEVSSRNYNGLYASMVRAYGASFNTDNPVTAVEYMRIK